MRRPPGYRHLALDGRWPAFDLRGLTIDANHALGLAPIPDLASSIGTASAPFPGLSGPIGIGTDLDGNLYVADPVAHRVVRIDGCDSQSRPLHCWRGPGGGPGELNQPHGVIVGPRRTLFVADRGNRRIQLVDLDSEQVVGIWGPRFADDPVIADVYRFGAPTDLAMDSQHFVYVADPGALDANGQPAGGRVRKFDVDGHEDAGFATTISASGHAPSAPIGVAATLVPGADPDTERILVLDSSPAQILVFACNGTFDAAATSRWRAIAGRDPRMVRSDGRTLYVVVDGDRIASFDASGAWMGITREERGAIAGIAVDCRGRLVAHGADDGTLRRADVGPTFSDLGSFLAGPFDGPTDATRWQRVRLDADVPTGTHLTLFTLVSQDSSTVPTPPFDRDTGWTRPDQYDAAETAEDSALDRWRAAPVDALDLLALHAPGRRLWIAGLLTGGGNETPVLRQIRIEHDRDGALAELPAFYRRDDVARRFLERSLSVFESVYRDERAALADLPVQLDANGAPDVRRAGDTWLDWLASWVDARPREDWGESDRRARVANAFQQHARRGTRAGLRDLVRAYTGAWITIEDAGSASDLWQLGIGALGFSTALVPEPAEGAVVGTTSVLDHSRLEREEEFGRPAWEDAAHRFYVEALTAGAPSDTLDRIREVLDREKPAHTVYVLCPIEPRMRVGFQARLGIDSIVSGPPAPTPLGVEAARENGLRLHGPPPRDAVGETVLTS